MEGSPTIDPRTFPQLAVAFDEMDASKEKVRALQDAIDAADSAADYYYMMRFRYELIYAYMDLDPIKTLPLASEFVEIYDAHPFSRAPWCDEALLIFLAYAIVNAKSSPDVALDGLMSLVGLYRDHSLRLGIGEFTYHYVLFKFYEDVDLAKAMGHIEQMIEARECDIGYPDCIGCALSDAIAVYLRAEQLEKAALVARTIDEGAIDLCEMAPLRRYERYLEHALDEGDVAGASACVERMEELPFEEWGYLPMSYVRFMAYRDVPAAQQLMEVGMAGFSELVDPSLVLEHAKAFWAVCSQLAMASPRIEADFPASFPLYREDGIYDAAALAEHFKGVATSLAARFDARNGTDFRMREVASCCAFEDAHA